MTLDPELQFSYRQFFVYDAEIVSPACEWTEAHYRQGFARQEGAIAVGTLLEFGAAEVTLITGTPSSLDAYERAISMPLRLRSRRLAIDGPEEQRGIRCVAIDPGRYLVTVAQRVVDDMREEIRVWVTRTTTMLGRSEILVADEALDISAPLVETANRP